MRKRKLILYGMTLAAASWPALCASPYSINANQVAATLGKMGMHVSPGQVTMLTEVVAAHTAPVLKVRSIEPWGNQRMLVRLECESQKECLPFFVGLKKGDEPSMAAGNSNDLPAAGAVPSPDPKRYVVRSGSPAILLLDSDRVHIRIPVTCLENGAPGQTIRVRGGDHRVIFTAQVVDSAFLKGRL